MNRSAWRGMSTAVAVVALALAGVGGLAAPSVAAGQTTIAGAWTAIHAFPDGVTPMAVTTAADGRIYLFGTCYGSCKQLHGTVGSGATVTYVYDPATDRWAKGVGAPAICAGAMAAAPGGDGLIHLGGCWNDLVHDRGVRIALYDATNATWSYQPGVGPYFDPTAGMRAADGAIDWFGDVLQRQGTAVFIVGHRVVVDESGLWFRGLGVPNTAPSDAVALGQDGRVYAFGGWRNCQPQFGACPVPPVQAWRPLTNTWTQVARLPTPRIRLAAATDRQGRIFTIGGLAGDASRMFATVQVYVPGTRTWWKAAPLPAARMAAFATATSDGRVWILGGYDTFGMPLRSGYCFTPAPV